MTATRGAHRARPRADDGDSGYPPGCSRATALFLAALVVLVGAIYAGLAIAAG